MVSPRIVYGPSLTQIIFDLPLENREVQDEVVNFDYSPNGTVKTSASGKTETVVNFIERRLTLQFRLIDKPLKDALENMYLEWAVFGNPFFFYPDKEGPEFFAFILDERSRNFNVSAVGTKWDVAISSRTVLEPEPEVPPVGEVSSVNGKTGAVILDGSDINDVHTGLSLSDAIELAGFIMVLDADNATIGTPVVVDFNLVVLGTPPTQVGILAKSSGGGGGGANDTGSGDVAAIDAGDIIITDSADSAIITIPGGRGGYTDAPNAADASGLNVQPPVIGQPLLVDVLATESGSDGGGGGRAEGLLGLTYTGQEGETGLGVHLNINLPPDKILKFTMPTGGAGATEATGEDGGNGRDGNIIIHLKRFTLA
jgi:hypothetical protein